LNPLVSIIMPSLNQKCFIGAAIDSVLSQSWHRLELIVIDGGSIDGTTDLLKKIHAQDQRLRWISEPDRGPAHALNKALARCRGTLIGWLNSDDCYTSEAIQYAAEYLLQQSAFVMVYGHGQHIDSQGNIIDNYPTRKPDVSIDAFVEGCFICQPTVMFKRSFYLLQGPLNEKLKTTFDFDYWLRAFKNFPDRIGFIERVQAQSRLHENCITLKQRRTIAVESTQVLYWHLGYGSSHWLRGYALEKRSQSTSETNKDHLHQHLLNCLNEVSPWLLKTDYENIKQEILGL
jgi:glycosyltransferase involved in cell wall biosynthesis